MQKRFWLAITLFFGLGLLIWTARSLTIPAAPPATATLVRPTPRPTFPFPTGTGVPVTSAEGTLIETEPGPLYVIVSTTDEHGLKGQALLELFSQPDPNDETAIVTTVRSGTIAEVLEIRRMPPDYLRGFYLVSVNGETGWVGDYYARRIVYVVEFDEQGCACAMPIPFWSDAALTQPNGTIDNRSPIKLLSGEGSSVQVQILSNGAIGWLSRDSVFESQENEFLKYIQP
jgi:hypothetical protein